MIFRRVDSSGGQTLSESLISILGEMRGLWTPELNERFLHLRCPEHNCQLTELTVREFPFFEFDVVRDDGSDLIAQEDERIIGFEFHAPCEGGEICSKFSDEALQVFEQDHRRSVEFVGPGLSDT